MIEQQVQSTRGGLAHDLLPSSSFVLKSGLVMIAVGLGCLLLGGFLASQLMLLGDLRPLVRTILRVCGGIEMATGTGVVVLHRRTRGVRPARRASEVALLAVLVAGGLALVPPALAAAVLLLEILIQLLVLGFVLLFGAAFALLVLRRS